MAALPVSVPPALHCAGVSATLGRGLHARIRVHGTGIYTVTLATFPLAAERDDVDEVASRAMRRDDVLVLVLGYGAGQLSNPAFAGAVRMPLTLGGMQTATQFEGMPRGHVVARRLFVAAGGAYDVQVQFARRITPGLAARAASILRRLRFHAARGC